ncbi:MAG: hypothetical protein QOI54_42 [Actinomycetota bacterium]|jgi:hypothetical protein|nr:hypothetical protein [Actinomycetota bacterium]
MSEPPRRVRIVAARRTTARAASRRRGSHEIDEQTDVGQVYMGSLLRTQLRLAIGVCLTFAVLLGGLPLLFATQPAVADTVVLGLPLPWFLLGVVVHPVLAAGAWFYVRQTERNERDWVELVERS